MMGADIESRFVNAADLIEEYLDTRIPEELEHYRPAVHLTESIVRRALSNEVITPGTTTVGVVRKRLYDELWRQGVRTWFQPDLRVQRKGVPNKTSRGFLHVADQSMVIERGDVVHLDFGLTYMGFDTDWQKKAYVLREGARPTRPPD
jgi:Xaa-Pro dipeptidase